MTAKPSVRAYVVLFAQVAFHLLDVGLTKQLQVFNRGILFVIHSDRAHLIELLIEVPQVLAKILRWCLTCLTVCFYTLLDAPNLANSGLNGGNKLSSTLFSRSAILK